MFKKVSVFFGEFHKRKAHIRKRTIGVNAIQIRPYQLPFDRQIAPSGKSNDHPISFILMLLLFTVCEYAIGSDIP